jgi:hypothetical protein
MRTVALLSVLAIVAACGPEPAYMEATVNGVLWQAEHVSCSFRSDPPQLEVFGSRSTGQETKRFIQLVGLPNVPATVSLTDEGPRGVIRDTDAIGWDTYVGYLTTADLTGTATITEVNVTRHGCSGTFSFVAGPAYGAATDTLNVTNGAWSVNLQVH